MLLKQIGGTEHRKSEEYFELLKESLEVLKDISNAADNGEPYDGEELQEMCGPILSRAYESGIRLNGEQ